MIPATLIAVVLVASLVYGIKGVWTLVSGKHAGGRVAGRTARVVGVAYALPLPLCVAFTFVLPALRVSMGEASAWVIAGVFTAFFGASQVAVGCLAPYPNQFRTAMRRRVRLGLLIGLYVGSYAVLSMGGSYHNSIWRAKWCWREVPPSRPGHPLDGSSPAPSCCEVPQYSRTALGWFFLPLAAVDRASWHGDVWVGYPHLLMRDTGAVGVQHDLIRGIPHEMPGGSNVT